MADIERIEPAHSVSWPKITRRPLDDEAKEQHAPPDDEPDEEVPEDDDDGHPHVDVRV